MDDEILKTQKNAINIGLDGNLGEIISAALSVRDNFYKKRIKELKMQLHYAKCAYEVVLENDKEMAQDTVERLKLFENYDKVMKDVELEVYDHFENSLGTCLFKPTI